VRDLPERPDLPWGILVAREELVEPLLALIDA
jgi:hypothetical protein